MQGGLMPFLSREECDHIRKTLEAQEWTVGQARTAELTGTIKRNQELKPGFKNEVVDALSKELTEKLTHYAPFITTTLAKGATAFKFNRYEAGPEGEESSYRAHTDAPWMGPVRTDFTVVVALTDPEEYEGGDHHVIRPGGQETIYRPDIGEIMYYETGYRHWVDPVTKGTRISALAWVETTVQGERQRALMNQCLGMSRKMEQMMHDESLPAEWREQCREWFVDVGVVHSGLHRLWADR